MITQQEVNEAIKTWLDYKDDDRYNEDAVRKLCWARITIREAFRQGYIMLNPNNYNVKSATDCQTAINDARMV